LLVLFGAHDRHNLGDLLFAHIVRTLLPRREAVVAGLAARDLRPWGGFAVQALADVARSATAGETLQVLHIGGEVLTCTAWQAAAMLLPPADAAATIAHLHTHPDESRSWVRHQLRTDAPVPYAAGGRIAQEHRPPGAACSSAYVGVGGVALDTLADDARAQVLHDLRSARAVTVRDRVTLGHLHAAGIAATLLPDPAVMVAELFAPLIRQRGRAAPVERVALSHPGGYVAVQCSAEFADDASLAHVAQQVRRAADAVARGGAPPGVVLFRAGAAPWHDDLGTLQRLAAQWPAGTVSVFDSLDVWDVCALIASSRAVVAASLHAGIVAAAFGLPCTPLRSPAAARGPSKHEAYAQTWGAPAHATANATADATIDAGATERLAHAARLARTFTQGFAALMRALDAPHAV
jgi:hypothetical protein